MASSAARRTGRRRPGHLAQCSRGDVRLDRVPDLAPELPVQIRPGTFVVLGVILDDLVPSCDITEGDRAQAVRIWADRRVRLKRVVDIAAIVWDQEQRVEVFHIVAELQESVDKGLGPRRLLRCGKGFKLGSVNRNNIRWTHTPPDGALGDQGPGKE